MVLDSLIWAPGLADPHVTVYFLPNGDSIRAEGGNSGVYTSEGFNAYEKAQFQTAFDLIASVCGLTFEVVTTAQAGASADLQLVLDTNEMNNQDLGFFNPPGEPYEGIGVFNGAAWDRQANGDLEQGGFGFVTIAHELLHGLGMAHPHDTGGGSTIMPGVTSSFDDYGDFDLNQGVYTTMTYNSGYFTGSAGSAPTSDDFGYEVGPMALDIAVLQQLYGIVDKNTGDDTYALPGSNTSGTYWSTIWDTDGTDEISYAGGRDVTIDLRAATLVQGEGAGGFISSADGVAGGFTIANGVVIENAKGGGGNDDITGNDAENVLRGKRGDDDLTGNGGNDKVMGNAGNDKLRGNKGDDRLLGNAGEDYLLGGSGKDLLKGQGEDDVLEGGGGADKLWGGNGFDTFVFTKASQSAAGSDLRDMIGDFASGTDIIDLSGIDANTNSGGDQSFTFVGDAGFATAGDLRLVEQGQNWLLQADVDGDLIADFEVQLRNGDQPLVSDFML